MLIRYPFEHQPEDEAWLEAVAHRHQGVLADEFLLSYPGQRTVTFEAASAANAFVDELTDSDRWKARIIP